MHIRDAVRTLEPYRPGQTRADLARFGLDRAVKLGSNENPLPPPPAVREAIVKAIDEVRLYPEPGAPRLRQAIAERYRRPVEETIAGSGVDELLDLTARVMLDPGDNLILAHPGFVRYAVAARLAGAEARLVPGTPAAPYEHDLEGMLAAIDDRTRIVVVVNPNNPTGSLIRRGDLERFLERVPPRVLTVLDEAYYEFVDDADYPNGLDYLGGERPLLVFRTFSKIHSLAGIRVGFGFGPAELIGFLDRARLPFSVNALAQAAGIAALGEEEHVRTSRALARAETAFLAAELSRRGWTVHPTATNFVFAEAPLPGGPLAEGLMRRGFILRPLTSFGLPDRFFRVSHGTREENVAFLAALDAVGAEAASR
jgi:histidinol-phosphate aminotransferase